MRCRVLCLWFFILFALAGCASTRVSGAAPPDIWQDQAFDFHAGRVTETRGDLFDLDPSVFEILNEGKRLGYAGERRLDLLLSRLYGPQGIRLTYTSGHSTGAMQTWQNRRGDCLSLTILTYAIASSLGITAHMQEVRVPVVVDRQHGVDFVNGHVNVYLRNDMDVQINGRIFRRGGIVIDFEPQIGANSMGDWLTEEGILARYFNNRAAEFLLQRDDAQAYAYYRAAIQTDPAYLPAFANLAQLYSQRGLQTSAERLLRHAIARDASSYIATRMLHQLLTVQGRTEEAQKYSAILVKLQDEDPYYWLGLGLAALRESRFAEAVRSLERAEALTTGFEEIHYHLALAYLRNGQRDAAQEQLAALSAINTQSPGLAALGKKLQGLGAPTSLH
jgi:Flp pilus assembly protein TadD